MPFGFWLLGISLPSSWGTIIWLLVSGHHFAVSSVRLLTLGHLFVFCFIWSDVGDRTEKAMAPHSSTLAWKIPWTEEPGRLQSMRSRIVGHD